MITMLRSSLQGSISPLLSQLSSLLTFLSHFLGLFSHLYSACAVTRRFGRYNCFYILACLTTFLLAPLKSFDILALYKFDYYYYYYCLFCGTRCQDVCITPPSAHPSLAVCHRTFKQLLHSCSGYFRDCIPCLLPNITAKAMKQ